MPDAPTPTPAPRPNAPERVDLPGWRLVPVEPTDEMIAAGDDLCPVARGTESHRISGGAVPEDYWAAMLSAAPTPPAADSAPPAVAADVAGRAGFRARDKDGAPWHHYVDEAAARADGWRFVEPVPPPGNRISAMAKLIDPEAFSIIGDATLRDNAYERARAALAEPARAPAIGADRDEALEELRKLSDETRHDVDIGGWMPMLPVATCAGQPAQIVGNVNGTVVINSGPSPETIYMRAALSFVRARLATHLAQGQGRNASGQDGEGA